MSMNTKRLDALLSHSDLGPIFNELKQNGFILNSPSKSKIQVFDSSKTYTANRFGLLRGRKETGYPLVAEFTLGSRKYGKNISVGIDHAFEGGENSESYTKLKDALSKGHQANGAPLSLCDYDSRLFHEELGTSLSPLEVFSRLERSYVLFSQERKKAIKVFESDIAPALPAF